MGVFVLVHMSVFQYIFVMLSLLNDFVKFVFRSGDCLVWV